MTVNELYEKWRKERSGRKWINATKSRFCASLTGCWDYTKKKEKMLDKEIGKAEEDKPYQRGARDAVRWCKDYLTVAADLIAGMGSKEESLEELDDFTRKEMEGRK